MGVCEWPEMHSFQQSYGLFCNCSMFCYMLLYVHSSIAIILIGKRELVAPLNLSSWGHVMVERLFLAVPQGCLRFVIEVFPDHTHLLFLVRVSTRHAVVIFVTILFIVHQARNL